MNLEALAIETRHEMPRGCGHRKEGGLYIMGGKLSAPCGRLPLPLDVCPTCHGGFKQTRSWMWIDPAPLFSARLCSSMHARAHLDRCTACPVGTRVGVRPSQLNMQVESGEKVGLMWVGGKFYPTTDDFAREAAIQGVSKRIRAVPNGLKIGETWCMIAHPQAVPGLADKDDGHETKEGTAGIFAVFQVSAIEYVVRAKDTAKHIKDLRERGITPVHVVPVTEETDANAV